MAVDMEKLLAPDADERDGEMWLRGIDECADRWSRLDETLGVIADALGQSG